MERPQSMGALFLAEFEAELANTRRLLERLPEEKFSWRPHPKSWTMAELATHVANLLEWAVIVMERDSLDLGAPDGSARRRPPAASRQELLEIFDRNAAAVRTAVAGARDEDLSRPWTLSKGEHTVFTLPRLAVLRRMVLNHGIHHRAQLSVYLRMNDVPVPGMYGPSADEA